MSYKTTIILAVIGLLLGGFFLFVEPKLRPTDDTEKWQRKVINPNSIKNISKMELRRNDSEITLEKRDEKGKDVWFITKPIQARADEYVMIDIVSTAKNLDKLNVVKKEAAKTLNLADYGLDKPRCTVSIYSDGKEYKIKFGKESGIEKETCYLQLEGDENIYVVSKDAFDKFNKDINALRNKHIIEYEPYKITKIRMWERFSKEVGGKLQYVQEESEVARRDDGWYLEKPYTERLEDSQVNALISGVKDLTAEDFVAKKDDLKEFGLDIPKNKIQIFEKDNDKPYEIQFGTAPANSDKTYAFNPTMSEITVVDANKFNALKKGRDDLRSTIVFDIKRDDIQIIAVKTSVGETIIERIEVEVEKEVEKDGKKEKQKVKEQKWTLKKPEGIKISENKVEQFVTKLLDIRVSAFLEKEPQDLATYGLKEPKATVTVTLKDGKGGTFTKSYLFSILADLGDAYMKKDWESQVYQIQRRHYDVLLLSELNFADDVIMSIPPTSIRRISVELVYETVSGKEAEDSYSCKLDDATGKWTAVGNKNREIDEEKINRIVSELSLVRVTSFIGRTPELVNRYKLNKPHIKITTEIEVDAGGAKKRVEDTLLIRQISEKSYYAKRQNDNIVFKISPFLPAAIGAGIYKEEKEIEEEGHNH